MAGDVLTFDLQSLQISKFEEMAKLTYGTLYKTIEVREGEVRYTLALRGRGVLLYSPREDIVDLAAEWISKEDVKAIVLGKEEHDNGLL